MGQDTAISWTDSTYNPVWGCTKVSEGCRNCYAVAFDKRVGGDHWGAGKARREFGDKHWREPLKWDKAAKDAGVRRRVFCGSMCDVFDVEWPEGVRERLWALIRQTPNLDWLLLTKRPERIAECLPADWGTGYPNVWLMTTCESQEQADKRIRELVKVPAVIHGLSCEPLIGPVDLSRWLPNTRERYFLARCAKCGYTGSSEGYHASGDVVTCPVCYDENQDEVDGGIDWVIVGGESGPGARPMDAAWARNIREQCLMADVAFFFKQWGGPRPGGEALLDGLEYHEFPTTEAQ